MDWLGDLGRQTGEALQGVGTAVGDGAKWTENAAKSALPTEVKIGFIKIQVLKEEEEGTQNAHAAPVRRAAGGLTVSGQAPARRHAVEPHREAPIPVGFIKIAQHPTRHDAFKAEKKHSEHYYELKEKLEKNKANLAKEIKEIDRKYEKDRKKWGV
eukprot:Tamp_20016.p1 GENE.Tamp_20016~~Tamp_20016.p1  ORF type:complete len:156 (-),score=43.35 Tamp_20016:698-1165(-)